MAPLFHDSFVMVLPGFVGRVSGKDAAIAGFEEFCQNAKVHAFQEGEHQIDLIGQTAIASVTFEMTYELKGQKYQSTGRDVWVFENSKGAWVAVWRTMLDTTDTAVDA
jgi:hypothetical protein